MEPHSPDDDHHQVQEGNMTGKVKVQNGKKKQGKWNLTPKKRQQITQTVILYVGFFSLGMSFSILGPTLLDIQKLTHTDTKTVSLIFLCRSIAGLVGAVVAGVTIPRLHHWAQLAVAHIVGGIFLISVPHTDWIVITCFLFIVPTIGGGFFDAGGNMVLLKVWGEENGPWMQALHCIFGLGALLGPLVAEPFLQDTPHMERSDLINGTNIYNTNPEVNGNTSLESHGTVSNISFTTTENKTHISDALPYQTDITWAYLIVGCCLIFGGILLFLVVFCCSEIKLTCRNQLKGEAEKEDKKSSKEKKRALLIFLLVLLFLYYLNYCVMEMNFGNYLASYIVKEHGWSEKEGAKITSVYWGTFTAGRFIGIFIIKYISPAKLLVFDMVMGTLSLGIMMFLSHLSPLVLWICTITFGFSISTIFATGITWAEIYIEISGGIGAIFMIAGAGGEMVGPAVIGALFDTFGPQSFLYVMFVASCILILDFGVMSLVVIKLGRRKITKEPEKEVDEGHGEEEGMLTERTKSDGTT